MKTKQEKKERKEGKKNVLIIDSVEAFSCNYTPIQNEEQNVTN